jgi:uncharacterized protein YfaS (alpha-2-macroglobulin family)
MPGQRGTEAITCEGEVMDLSRQTVASASSSLVHPAEFYLGVRLGADDFVNAGDKVRPEIIAVDPAGKRRVNVAVQAELLRRSWVTARESGRRGGYHSVTRRVDKVVSECSAVTKMTAKTCALTVPKAGYYIVRVKAQDRRKNAVSASTYLYALGKGEVGWGDDDTTLGRPRGCW